MKDYLVSFILAMFPWYSAASAVITIEWACVMTTGPSQRRTASASSPDEASPPAVGPTSRPSPPPAQPSPPLPQSPPPQADAPAPPGPVPDPRLSTGSDLTRILSSIDSGDPKAADELLPMVYEELRRLAHHKMSLLPPGQTLQPTALVHEAFVRLVGSPTDHWQNRRHFFAAAAEAMRHLLIDHSRRKQSCIHGGGKPHIDLAKIDVAADADTETLQLVDEALEKLAEVDRRAAEFVKLRYFAGMRHNEIAEVLGLSERSSKRIWTFARAWLFDEIRREL